MPTARFFFDAGSGTVLWRSDAPPGESFVDLGELPVSAALREELVALVAEYDTSLNGEYPPNPGPWREDRCGRFNEAVREVLGRLRAELPDWGIEDRFRELHEDPDLDRYLADPVGFHREEPRGARLHRWVRRSRSRRDATGGGIPRR